MSIKHPESHLMSQGMGLSIFSGEGGEPDDIAGFAGMSAYWEVLELQFQKVNLQREGFLDIGLESPLEVLQNLHVC
jgi:hypothetical protein